MWIKGYTINTSAYELKSNTGIVHADIGKLIYYLVEMFNSLENLTTLEITRLYNRLELGTILNSVNSNGPSLQIESSIPINTLSNNSPFIFKGRITSLFLNGENKINLPINGNKINYYLVNRYNFNQDITLDDMLNKSSPVIDYVEWCYRAKTQRSFTRLCNHSILPVDINKPFFITYFEVETVNGVNKVIGLRLNLHTPSSLDTIFQTLRSNYLTNSAFAELDNPLKHSMYKLE